MYVLAFCILKELRIFFKNLGFKKADLYEKTQNDIGINTENVIVVVGSKVDRVVFRCNTKERLRVLKKSHA